MESKLKEVQNLCAEDKSRLEIDPGNFARQIQLRSTEAHLADLQQKLHLAKAERNKAAG